MAHLTSNVFFYGLFMDAAVLEATGVAGSARRPAVLRDWTLRVGERATIVPAPGETVFGIVMTMSLPNLHRLYRQPGLCRYRAAAVLAQGVADDASPIAALAYVLPKPPGPSERNPDYAAKLRALAVRLGFPVEYIESIAYTGRSDAVPITERA
jgi:hypothetical protein